MGIESPQPRSKPKELAAEIGAGVLGMAIVMVGLVLIDNHLWPACSFWVAIVLYPLMSLLMVYYAFNVKEMVADLEKDLKKGEAGDFYLTGLPLMHFVSFVLLCRAVYIHAGPESFTGLPESPNILNWLLFGLDNVMATVLLDATEAYGWHFSSMHHTKTFAISTLIFSYRAALSIGLIHIIVTTYQTIQKKRAEKAAGDRPGTA